jgi:hypothetical protein
MQTVLLLRYDAACTDDYHALQHIKLQRPKLLAGVIEIGPEWLRIGIALDESQDQCLACVLPLEVGG